jgi:hypothetical protein
MATATARPLLPSILKAHKRDREPCNDGAFTIDSILAVPVVDNVLPPLTACTAVDCEGFQQQQKGQESSSNDGTVHKKPRLDTTHMITTQTEMHQGILHSLYTLHQKIQSMDRIMHGMQVAFKSHENIMGAIIDSVSLLQPSKVPEPQKPEAAPDALSRESALSPRYPTPRHSGSSSIQEQDKDTALALDPVPQTAPPPANASDSYLEVLAGVAVDQLMGTRVRWAEPLHDTSKHDSAPTNIDMSGDFTSNFTIIDFVTLRLKQDKTAKYRIVVWMNQKKSTYVIYDNVIQATTNTPETQCSIYKALNQDLTGNKTWFYLEDCLLCLCASTCPNQHEMAYKIAKERIKGFKIHWHGHSHKDDTWETFENVNRLAVVEFFRDRMHMKSIIDHTPKAVSWREAVQNHETKYKVVDHENFLQPKSKKSMTYWVTGEKLSTGNKQEYLDAYYLKN